MGWASHGLSWTGWSGHGPGLLWAGLPMACSGRLLAWVWLGLDMGLAGHSGV